MDHPCLYKVGERRCNRLPKAAIFFPFRIFLRFLKKLSMECFRIVLVKGLFFFVYFYQDKLNPIMNGQLSKWSTVFTRVPSHKLLLHRNILGFKLPLIRYKITSDLFIFRTAKERQARAAQRGGGHGQTGQPRRRVSIGNISTIYVPSCT